MFHLTTPQANIKEISIKSIWYGLIAGMISGMVKIGWENLFPPRTIARNLINPPQHMAMQLGVPKKLVESFVYYSQDQKVFWFTLILHLQLYFQFFLSLSHNIGLPLDYGKERYMVLYCGLFGTLF